MEPNVFDKIQEVDLKKTMENSYIDYAMSVIASRALPDVRDGLKPVQRRVLYSMIELNNGPDKPHRKSARIVGDTMGKYHPHGDSSIYGSLVYMAQKWNERYPLVDGHGNFGSVDGDGAAAMRYTEARLSKISMELLADINKDTVDFVPNFDETEKEPTVLPARFPNLLVNGATGIAVGMATNIPPHNLREVIDAIVKIIDNRVEEDRETELEEVMEIVKGPDFPTGATILGRSGIEEAYRTGRGKLRVRAEYTIETLPNGKTRILVTELPYMVNKARLIEKIANLVKEKRIDGITTLRDESNREGMRINIELRRDVNANVVLNQLLRHTQLQDTFGVIMLALVNNEPRVMNLLEMLSYYLKHQEDVVTRRTKYDLNKAEERAHILEGLLKALDVIDEVIRIIRAAANVAEAKTNLIAAFGFSDAQAQAIVDMRLRALTGLEREKLLAEYQELERKIAEWRAILGDEKLLLGVIRKEITEVKDRYGDDRRTRIGWDENEIDEEDMIPDDDVVITMTHLGYIKRMSSDNFKSQNRGGKGIRGMATIDEDYLDDLLMTTNLHSLMFFTNRGRVYRLKAYEIPEAGRTARGTAIINLIPLQKDEKVTAFVSVEELNEDDKYLFMATKSGIVKRGRVSDYQNVRKNGLQAITLREGDELIEVKATDNNQDIILVSKKGMCIRFHETDVRVMGRITMGVMGMRLDEDDEVIGMQLASQGECLLVASEYGYGKRTRVDEFKPQYRGGKGILCYRVVPKTGYLIGAKLVDDNREIMLITNEGIIIQMPVNNISIIGRNTSGVKLMNIDAESGASVAGIAKVRSGSESGEEDVSLEDEDLEEENGENDGMTESEEDTGETV